MDVFGQIRPGLRSAIDGRHRLHLQSSRTIAKAMTVMSGASGQRAHLRGHRSTGDLAAAIPLEQVRCCVVYRGAPYREPPLPAHPLELTFFSGTLGDVLTAALSFGFLVLFVLCLPWDAHVSARCDRTTCWFADRSIPFAAISRLEIEPDADSDWTSTRVVARLADGSVAGFGAPSTSTDDDEKQTFVTSFAQFKAGDSPYWEATYGTSDRWIVSGMQSMLILVALGWLATRKQIRLTRFAGHVNVRRRSLVRRWHSTDARLEDISELTHDASSVLHIRLRDGSSLAIGRVSTSREHAIERFLEVTARDHAVS